MKIDFEPILKAMQKAPTGDNAQPFRYKINDNVLIIQHDTEIAMHLFNPNNIASMVALGMQIESCRQAALDQSLEIKYSTQKNLETKIEFSKSSASAPSLLHVIHDRHTDRRPYRMNRHIPKCLEKFKSREDVFIDTEIDEALLSETFQQEKYMFDDYQAFSSVIKYVRFSRATEERLRTGFNAGNLGLDPITTKLFKLYMRRTFLHDFLTSFFRFTTYIKVKLFYRMSAGFIHFTVDSKELDQNKMIKSGETIMKLWLELTAAGYNAQPVSMISLLPYSEMTADENKFIRTLQKPYKKLRERLGLSTDTFPIFTLRYGKPLTKMKERDMTLRMNTEDVVIT